jgi:type IV pilus assembly protein PilX
MNTVFKPTPLRFARSQRGFSLITSLLLMLSVLLLGIAVMGVNVSQERIIGNTRDRELALQAAEATLRDAERDIQDVLTPATVFTSDCNGGLCIPASQSAVPNPKPIHEQAWFDWGDNAKTRQLGQHTSAPAFPGVSSPPVYVIEKLGTLAAAAGESLSIGTAPAAPAVVYRTTVKAPGARAETQVILQTLYQKPN